MTAGLAEYRAAVALAQEHAERLIVFAQAEAGDSVPYATRPLTPEEKAAKVRFALLDAIEERAVKDAQAPIEELFATVSAALLGAVDGAGEDEARETLQDLLLAPPEDVVDGIGDAAGKVEGTLADAYVAASAVALDEADRQGVKTDVAPLRATPGQFAGAARSAASRVWTRTAQVVQEDALTVGATATPETVQGALNRARTAGALDQARQGVHEAQGTGRIDTIEAVVEANGGGGTFYASELLDGNQCSRCEPVDGRQYATLADARVDYPNGYYQGCLGGARCRGTIVSIYRGAERPEEENEPTPAPAPDPEPENPTTDEKPVPGFTVGAPEDIETARYAANPSRGTEEGYKFNCSNVVVAVEARRRGYKVQALPKVGRGGVSTEDFEVRVGREFAKLRNTKAIPAYVAEQPDGARGVIAIGWKAGGGHIYNWEKVDGKIRYFEGQMPDQDASKYLSKRHPRFYIQMMRVDDLDLAKALKEGTSNE